MKVKETQIARALDNPDGTIRLYLLYGPDESASRALAARLEHAMGPDAERIDIDGAILKDDPGRLAGEAASISLFGTRRHICVTGGDECTGAVSVLLDAVTAGDPVVLIAGALKPASTLLKRALNDKKVLGCASYKVEGNDAHAMATNLGRSHGLRLTRSAAQQLAENCVGDRGILEREIEKLALYLDAAPDRPRDADGDSLDAIGAGLGETDMSKLVDAVLTGTMPVIADELAMLGDSTRGPIPALRGVARRLLLLANMRAEVEMGKAPSAVMTARGKALYFKETASIGAQLSRWNAVRLRTAATRVFAIEAAIKTPRTAGDVLAAEELVAIGRVAERLR